MCSGKNKNIVDESPSLLRPTDKVPEGANVRDNIAASMAGILVVPQIMDTTFARLERLLEPQQAHHFPDQDSLV